MSAVEDARALAGLRAGRALRSAAAASFSGCCFGLLPVWTTIR